MMKNRAGLLALVVLAAATLLMVFFVLPRVTGDKQPIGDVVNDASESVKDVVEKSAGNNGNVLNPPVDVAAGLMEKMGRLSASSEASVSALKALFASGAIPTADQLAAAREKAMTALNELLGLEIPKDLDAATTAALGAARDVATKALDFVKSLPADPQVAAATLNGQNTGAPATADATPAPATDTTKPPADTAAASDDKTVPAFDVLRVEPDGSTVIAGKAAPGSKLEILDGDAVISSSAVGDSGDFAAVLDNPLPAGDHQLVLKVTKKDGTIVLSDEVATVSVPATAGGELLAMVTKPGAASRIIAAPGDNAPAADENVATATKTDRPAASSGDVAVATPPAGDKPAPAPTAAATGEKPEVQVTAVEIEADKIFIAGVAKAGARVVGYADDTKIGESRSDTTGHFVIDGVASLAVGSHTIRVDVLDAQGKVVVRAAVPFDRPEGEQVSVVAQNGNAAATGASASLDSGAFDKLRGDAGKAFALLRGLFADGKLPGDEQLAAARSATEIALRSLSEFNPATDASDLMRDLATRTSKAASEALKAMQALPRDAKSVAAGLDKIAAMIDALLQTPAATDQAASSTEPKMIAQAPLTESKNSVIIRRGDTLWQISRRIYGRGVRYTTIYVANKDQIHNPDSIQPGQIFGVPKEALPDSEEIHRKHQWGKTPS